MFDMIVFLRASVKTIKNLQYIKMLAYITTFLVFKNNLRIFLYVKFHHNPITQDHGFDKLKSSTQVPAFNLYAFLLV